MLSKIKSITKIENDSRRYDIGVVDNHNFIANGVVVHNSLGILFNYNDEWIWATRGSFESDQAMWAKNFFESNYSYDSMDENYTHMFEIIFADNRIVVEYDEDRLVSLGSVHTETGIELVPNPLFPVPERFTMSIEELQNYEQSNFEGFVLKFKSGYRVKIKLDEYVKLHRIIFGLSSYTIWEALMNGTYYELLSGIPEEFLDWTQKTASRIQAEFHRQMADAYDDFRIWTPEKGSRKDIALSYQEFAKPPLSARFSILDGKDPSDIIWKVVKPEHQTLGQE